MFDIPPPLTSQERRAARRREALILLGLVIASGTVVGLLFLFIGHVTFPNFFLP